MIIIDRFEGDYAVVETDLEIIDIPRAELPANAKEGDVLKLVIDTDTTNERKKQIGKMMDNLFKN